MGAPLNEKVTHSSYPVNKSFKSFSLEISYCLQLIIFNNIVQVIIFFNRLWMDLPQLFLPPYWKSHFYLILEFIWQNEAVKCVS